jgi:hypothetical protein
MPSLLKRYGDENRSCPPPQTAQSPIRDGAEPEGDVIRARHAQPRAGVQDSGVEGQARPAPDRLADRRTNEETRNGANHLSIV